MWSLQSAAADEAPPRSPEEEEEPLEYTLVIVGGGVAAAAALSTLVEGLQKERKGEQDHPRVLLVTEERAAPYERAPLSTSLWVPHEEGVEAQTAALTRLEWRETKEDGKEAHTPSLVEGELPPWVHVLTGVRVEDLDVRRQLLLLEDGTVVRWQRLLLATGAQPALLDGVEEAAQSRVRPLHTYEDWRQVAASTRPPLPGHVALVGSTQVAASAAWALREWAPLQEVTLVAPQGVLGQVAPPLLQDHVAHLLEAKGVRVVQAPPEGVRVHEGRLVLRAGSQDLHVDHVGTTPTPTPHATHPT